MKKTTRILSFFLTLLIIGCSGDDGVDGINGINGLNSLVVTVIEQSGSNCPNGGFQIQSGIDINSNNQLETGEIDNTEFICNGEDANLGYKTYVFLLSQSDTDNPTSIVLENTLELDVNWTRESQGEYMGNLNNPVDINKTVVLHNNLTSFKSVRVALVNSNQINIQMERLTGFFDDNFDNLSIELRVYN